MNIKDKIALIESVLEVDEGTLNEDSVLGEQGDWDSLTQLSLIIVMKENFNKELTNEQIKGLNTVQDILNYME